MDKMNSTTGKLLAHACWAALVASVFGLYLGRTLIKHFDSWYFTGMVLSGAFLAFVLFWTRRAVRRLATANHTRSETVRKSARQFLFSCVFFSMISSTFGVAVSSIIWHSSDFIRTFGAVYFGVLTRVAIFPLRRDAKRLASVGPSQIAPH